MDFGMNFHLFNKTEEKTFAGCKVMSFISQKMSWI